MDLHGQTATFRLTDENENSIVETMDFSPVITANGYQGPLVAGQGNFPDCANHRALSGAEAAAEPGELVPQIGPFVNEAIRIKRRYVQAAQQLKCNLLAHGPLIATAD